MFKCNPNIRRIGILTGGGDCPGLNAVIRAVAKDAMACGVEVMGIEDGFQGLIEDRMRVLQYDDVSNILTMGGTVLGTSNKANPSRVPVGKDAEGNWIFKDLTDVCMTHLEIHRIDALVVIGGDGTMSCAAPFVRRGVPCFGVPKTIDNDLWGSDLTFGFLTAVQIATDALDRVHTTAASHHRVMVVEVMGRNAGWIALHAGVASGSDIILLPEIPFDLESVCDAVEHRAQRGRRFTIVCCSEGAKPRGGKQIVERVDPTSPDPIRLGGIGKWVAAQIEERSGVESRYCVLGHVQRGGTPVAADRVLATRFGYHATQLIREGRANRLVVWKDGKLDDADILSAEGKQRLVDPENHLISAARSVGTSFGD
ncbi:MAG: ATP-dependent 6-phosphofructokinase [Phycisphaerales bacterium]|jgi:6-phosphofructokinase 1|nr:ATP-dependent 6-phosphofructokinase [Phycisphaerales bacterium]